jgi:hypothetical protein
LGPNPLLPKTSKSAYINAKAESIDGKPAFRKSFERRHDLSEINETVSARKMPLKVSPRVKDSASRRSPRKRGEGVD